MTWIQVADSAIKIGLGALIAGAFGFLTLFATHRNSSENERARLKRVGVEKVAEIVDAFSVSLGRYFSRLRFVCSNVPNGTGTLPDGAIEALMEVDESFRSCLTEMSVATSRLRLIGQPELADKLRDAAKPLVQLRNDCMNERKVLSRGQIDEISASYREAISDFHQGLSRIYLA